MRLCALPYTGAFIFRKNICVQSLPMSCKHRSHDEFVVRGQTICYRGKEIPEIRNWKWRYRVFVNGEGRVVAQKQ
jgi:hypothetical protein